MLLVLALARECELVLGLAVRNLVDAEPLIGGAEQAGEVALDILDILQSTQLGRGGKGYVGWQTIELRGQRILLVDHNDFPIRLLLVQESHDA